jgi:hypothetical protein
MGKKLTDENRLSKVNPELCEEWDYEKNGDLTPDKLSYSSNKKVWWKCQNGHEWVSSPNQRHLKNKTNDKKYKECPYCYGRYASATNNLEISFPI